MQNLSAIYRDFQFAFNHSGLPSSLKSKFNLLHNFQDYFLMIDTNTFLFKKIIFTLTLKALGFFLPVQHWGVCFPLPHVRLDPDILES